MAPKQTDPQFKIRLPDELKSKLEAMARLHQRSLSAEILARLELSTINTEEKAHSLENAVKVLTAEQKRLIKIAEDAEEKAMLYKKLYEDQRADTRLEIARAESSIGEWKNLYFAISENNIGNKELIKSLCQQILSYGEDIPDELLKLAAELYGVYSIELRNILKDIEGKNPKGYL